MNFIFSLIEWIEQHPVTGGAILTATGIILIAAMKYIYSKKNVSLYIDPVFYSFGKDYVVTAVQEYILPDDASGYKQIQHTRPDQWSKLINITTSLFGIRHRVEPLDPSARLAVVIRTKKKGREKHILFNR